MNSSKKVSLFLLVLCLVLFSFSVQAKEKTGFPPPTGAVNDFAGVIPTEYKNKIARLSQEVLQRTGVAIVVATFPEIGDNSPEDFTNRLYQAWGIGRKGEDRGVLIFVAVKERKFRIETGYGVEGILPDGLVGEIRDRYAIPYLRKGDYGRGLLGTASAIAEVVTRSESVARPDTEGRRSGGEPGRGDARSLNWREILWLGVLIFVVLPFLLFTRMGRLILFGLLLSGGRGGGRGGFGGFGGGGFGGFGGGSSGGGGAGGSY